MAQARGIALLSKKRKYSALLLRTFLTSLVVMTTSRNWLKGFQPKTRRCQNCWALKIYSEWAKARRTTANHIEMSLLTDNRDALCKELCKFVVDNPVFTTGHPANSVWTAAIHQTGVATNASKLYEPLPPTYTTAFT